MHERQRHSTSLAALALLAACSSAESRAGSDGGASGAATTVNGGSGAAGGASAGVGGAPPAAGGGSPSAAGYWAGGTDSSPAGNAGSSAAGAAAGGGVPSTGGSGGSAGQAGAAGSSGSSGSANGTPGLRVVGRSAAGANNSLRFSWAGTSINARFTGTQVSMNLNDGNNKNRFSVVVDGGTPRTVTTVPGQTSLALASGLTNGMHELVIWRNTEASIGVSELTGLANFGTGGALLPPPAAPDRRIEVVGDSLSAGAGVEGTSTTCSPGIDAFTNNYLAYGSVAARSVQADVITIAWSGIGVYRSYSSGAATMPAIYDYAIPNDKTAWDFSKYQPQVVVINLGTNDFSSGNPGQAYVDAYVSFAKHVRSKYASANLILIDMYGGDRLAAINNVVSALKSGGESKVEALSFSAVPSNNTACNGHPNTAAQKAMGGLLGSRLKTLMNW